MQSAGTVNLTRNWFSGRTAQGLPAAGIIVLSINVLTRLENEGAFALTLLASANAQATWRLATKPGSTVTNVTEESPEYRGALPAWRVAFPDPTPQVFRCRWNWQDHRRPHQQLAALRLLLESRHHGLEEPRGF